MDAVWTCWFSLISTEFLERDARNLRLGSKISFAPLLGAL
jgi:hypothetical protein